MISRPGLYTAMRRLMGARRVIDADQIKVTWHPANRPKEIRTMPLADFVVWLELANAIRETE